MTSENELVALLADGQSFRVERTTSTTDLITFSEAVRAFANDMRGCGNAYLLFFLRRLL